MNLQAKFGEQEMKLTAPFKNITVVESVKPVYQEKTVTPTEEEQRVVADAGFDAIEAVNVKPIPKEYSKTSDATATADKVFLDETFYAGGAKKTGTFTIESELNSQDELIASIRSALAGKAAGGGNASFVESLQRDGIGYIDTGIDGANSNLKIEIRYEFNTMPTGYWNLVYAYSSESADCTRILYNKNNYVITSLNSAASNSISDAGVRYVNVVYTDI